jgi:hypothetical protein
MFNLSCKCALFLIVFSVITFLHSFSQTLTITPVNTSFTISNATQVSSSTTLASSFVLNIVSDKNTYNLYAAVTAKSFNPSSTSFSPLPVNFSLSNISAGSQNGAVFGNVQLSDAPTYATLGTNMAKTSRTGYNWTYDLVLLPVNFTTPPGTYVFTIQVQLVSGSTTVNKTFSVSVNVQTVVAVSLQQNSSTSVTFSSASSYTNGITLGSFHSLQVKSNIPWLVSVAAPAYFTAASQGADANMPCSIVSIKPTTGISFITLSASAQTIKTGIAGDVTATGNTSSFDMRFNPSYNYSPGIYNISLTYTLTNQ